MLSRGFLRTLWLWRSDHFFACGHASQFNSQEILASAHYPSSTRSDEGLESKRGADVTYHTGKYNLALKSRESGRNPHTIHTRGSTRTVTRQDLGRVSSNRIIMEVSEVQKCEMTYRWSLTCDSHRHHSWYRRCHRLTTKHMC